MSNVAEARPDGLVLRGTLVLHGHTRRVVVPARRHARGWTAEVSIHQPDFGIRPYRAIFSAVRVHPGVIVRAAVRPA